MRAVVRASISAKAQLRVPTLVTSSESRSMPEIQRVTLDAGDFCGVGDDIQRCVHRLNYSTDRIVYTYRTYSAIFIDNIV